MAAPARPTTAAAPARLHRAAIGRADLLRLMMVWGDDTVARLAPLCGFEVAEATPEPHGVAPVAAGPGAARRSLPAAASGATRLPLRADHFGIVESTVAEPDTTAADDALDSDGDIFDDPLQSDADARPPQPAALVPTRRMAAYVRRCLRQPGPSRLIDVDRWVALVSQAKLPMRLPTRRVPGWHHGSALVIDGSPHLQPISHDLQQLAVQALRWSGGRSAVYWRHAAGHCLQASLVQSGNDLDWRPVSPAQRQLAGHWLLVATSNAAVPGVDWPGRLRSVLARGGTAHWLRPQAWAAPPIDMPAGVQAATWDLGAPLRPRRASLLAPAQSAMPGQTDAVSQLLAAMSMAVRVEPALLRAIRQRLHLPIDLELEAWQHADVDSCEIACQVRPERLSHYRALMYQQPLVWRHQLAALIDAYHPHLSPLIRMEEAAIAADLAPQPAADPAALIAAAPPPWLKAARTLKQAPGSVAGQALARYVRRTAGRAHAELWRANPGLAETWVRAEEAAVRAGAALPAGLPAAAVRRVLASAGAAGSGQSWHLVQQRAALRVQQVQPLRAGQVLLGPVGPIHASDGVLVAHAGQRAWRPLPTSGVVLGRLDGDQAWQLELGPTRVTVSALQRPAWAQEWGVDRRGRYALSPWLGNQQQRFEVTVGLSVDPAQPFLPPLVNQLRVPATFRVDKRVEWLWGLDRSFGIHVEMKLAEVIQRFRWLPPGEFWMGSPDDEPERYKNEGPCHRVRLSQGFWLADSACTQALWQALMGNNPSDFKGDEQRPVENVSFDDVQAFLARLQALLPTGCEAVLPTEAEWEYACRAGTDTPFNLPAPISRASANFDAGAAGELAVAGEESRSTVPVKSLPPNAWGLYEMHGNVWEWCADDQRDYAGTALPEAALEDPWGPDSQEQEAQRAVRGGSWIALARSLRSARRGRAPRGDRDRDLGFRVALRSSPVGLAPEGPASGLHSGPEAPGVPARRDAGPAPRGWVDRVRDLFQPAAAQPPQPPGKKKPPKR